jgi:FAD/FMN-containing dehydrogenase
VPPAPCWLAVPFAELNASVGGRLAASVDPLAACAADGARGPGCAALLNATDDEFFLTSQPAGFTRPGVFGAWNLTTVGSAYAVLAESEADVAAAVAFAARYNLRLAVKGTGHDWYARSTSRGALTVWTHRMANIAFDAAFVPEGCGGTAAAPVDAALVEAGVQFRELYAAAQQSGRLVIGGTCDSVGVGGCWLGGCFGTWSKLYGSAASNLLQARVVLANGSVVVANACQNSDLFWALRGGGGGTFGVVTQFVARTHRPPTSVLLGSHSFTAIDEPAFTALLEQMLLASRRFMAPPWGGGVGFGRSGGGGKGFAASIGPKGFEVAEEAGQALLQPLLDFVRANATAYPNPQSAWSTWNASSWAPGAPLPWIEVHPDREISTMMVASFGRLPTMAQTSTPAGVAAVAAAFAAVAQQVPASMQGTIGLDFEKGQAGASASALALLADTSQQPILADAIGLLLVAYRFPFLPTLPRSSAVLAALWPRLQVYVVRGAGDALFAGCAAGAAGDEAAAAACLDALAEQRAPALQAGELAAVNATLRAAFPNVDAQGRPVSGGYTNEADHLDPGWQASFWGSGYARLRAVKDAVDPAGLFVCHHCVGSEAWSSDGNCRLEPS